jgi:hypothetical protein
VGALQGLSHGQHSCGRLLTEAEAAKPLGAGISKPQKQAILARARQLAGSQEEEIECEIYKKKNTHIPSLVVKTL